MDILLDTQLAIERHRARQQGIDIVTDPRLDRYVPEDAWDQCPTCEDGILTVVNPNRCRECRLNGGAK